ncbi:HpcH/HpaI aldolase family protein [Calidithermus roseus]|uniref:5-keto-4-deoxy-D-glucarate aldolase n=1 Tax=Calidithermus roseus TaxID=1644118 RepID=A0A399ETG1_9DEIN|nr:aldolase/citrate lyase family protein [Calidithermus roseus]RIH87894.1 5-keto-4-deoxy-D-glucarate aldolase [Calidithermus roseus]
MRENRVRTLWEHDQTAVCGWLHLPDAYSAEVMARAGWDALTIDLEHGLMDFQVALSMLQAISTTDVLPLARIPWNEPGIAMRLLDAGCMGIICPMVSSQAQAEAFVGACRYPPLGYRSFGPTRALLYAGDDYAEHANREVITLAMIETEAGLENLEEILAVAGLDGVFVGPGDLSQSLGEGARLDREDPAMLERLEHIAAVARSCGKVVGIFARTPEYARRMSGIGYRFVALSSDARMLMTAARAAVDAFHGTSDAMTAKTKTRGY